MSAHVFRLRCSLARRPPCTSCIPSRAHYSQTALPFAAARTQDSNTFTTASPSGTTRTATQPDVCRTVADTRDPLEPTRLGRYLASIRAADLEPTLDDVEQCKPKGFPRPDSSRYATEYTSLVETLCRSFSKDQLRRFTELYKLEPIWTRSSRRKIEYAESIVEKAWGWPSLKEIERKRRDMTEVLEKSFTVTPSQLFLIMGKDGADLLQLSIRYNVRISLTASPLALRVEGLRGSLKGLSEHVSSFKKGIIDKIYELPTGRPVRPDLLQKISRLAGAYVENHGNRGKIRICAKDSSNITTAEQLALRASLVIVPEACTVCYDPPSKTEGSPLEAAEPPRYSMYPFVTPYPFPWTMHSGGAFRLRRVAEWLDVDSYEDIASTGGLADNSHRLLKFDRSGQKLSQLVCQTTLESTSYRRRVITASLGHILISSNEQRPTIVPPTRDALSLSDIFQWVETDGKRFTFVPSAPPTMMTLSASKQISHRLIYRTLPGLVNEPSKLPQYVLKFEVELPAPSSTNNQTAQGLESSQQLKDALSSEESGSNADAHSSQETVSHPDRQPDSLTDKRQLICQAGVETYVNLMLPDRPMDIQLCVFDWDDIPLTEQPWPLQQYAEKLRDVTANKDHLSRPIPPSTFSHEGREYYLYDSSSVTHGNSRTLSSTISGDHNADEPVETCSENIVDLQSSEKTQHCQVKLYGTAEGPSWKRFLATCDQLSITALEWRRRKDNLKQQRVHLDK